MLIRTSLLAAYDVPAAEGNPPPTANYTPPAYEVATKLPSYDEAERTKASEAGFLNEPECPDRAARQSRRANGTFFFWVSGNLI